MVIDTQTSETGQLFVLLTESVEELSDLLLAHRQRQLIVALEADTVRYLGIKAVEVFHPHLLQHRPQVVTCLWEILIH